MPELPKSVEPPQLGAACPPIDAAAYDTVLAGSPHRFGDYKVGEKIDHVDGITVEEAEHRSRRGFIRTPRASISTSSPRAKAASAAG